MEEIYFKKFFKNSPKAYAFLRPVIDEKGIPYDYEFIEINEAVEKMLCVKSLQVIGTRVSKLYHKDYEQFFDKMNETAKSSLINNKTVELDAVCPLLNKWLRLEFFPIDTCVLACIIYDLTEEYKQEKQIEWFLNSNLDIQCVWDFNTDTYRVNKKFENIVGYNFDEIKQKSPLSLVYEEDLEASLKVLEKLKRHIPIENFVNRFKTKDGSVKYLQWECESHFNYAYLSGRDITANYRKKTELFIKKQLDLIKTIDIIDNLEVGYGRYSYPEYELIDMNNKAYSILKSFNPNAAPLSSLIGKNHFEVFEYTKKDEIRFKNNIQKIANKKVNYICDYRTKKIKNGKGVFKIILHPIFGLNNEVIELISIAVDITEEFKEKSEMMKTIRIQEELLANISHELKTPLNVIFSQNQLMGLYLKNGLSEINSKKLSKGINIIKQNCYRLTKLVNNIVDLSKIKSGFLELNLSDENIVDIIDEIVHSVSDYVKGKGLNITFNSNTRVKIIACDPEKIERIMLNLISNAIKFTNSGGDIFVNLIDNGTTVELSVQDTGIGIPKKDLTRIFEKFHQVDKSLSRNTEGSGIGLSIVKYFVRMHYGKISVESEVGKGSIFKIELPVRTVNSQRIAKNTDQKDNRVQMINVEFSDIYSL